MKITELIRLIWINVKQNRFKVMLTSLGIIVGTLTIVLVIATGRGGEQEAARQFSGLSADTIYIKPDWASIYSMQGSNKIEKLDEEDLGHIMDETTVLSGIYLRESGYKQVKIKRQKANLSIVGVTEGYAEISNFTFAAGNDFSESDYEQGSSIVVIGHGIAETYFNGAEGAVGEKLVIDQTVYKVVGVLSRSGDGLQGLTSDDSVFMTYKTFKKAKITAEDNYAEAVGKAISIKAVPRAIKEITSTLNYYMVNGDKYNVEDAGSRIEAATKSARTMKLLLIAVAAIVFVVGGIGIMNVLFVTIKERTKEIGILKALGSKQHDILLQFLLESVAIGIFGGGVGVLLSFGALPLLSRYTDIPIAPSFEGFVLAFGFAVLTGTCFGFYPAYKASQLVPVEALNHD